MRTFLLIAALSLPAISFAQLKSEGDSVPTSYTTLHHNAPQLINMKNVPRFALIGKEEKYYIGIGADIKVTPVYDFGSPIDDPNLFTTSAIPLNTPAGDGAQFRLSAQQSEIFLNVVALPGSKQQIGAYVSFNFLGNNYTPQLTHAYLKYHDVTAGYTYTIFSDVAASPATIDYEGPNSMTALTHCMIAYEPYLDAGQRWRAGISLDIPEDSYTNSTHTQSVTQRLPDIPFYLQYYFLNEEGWLRVAGIVRNLYYRNLVAQRNVDKIGGGVALSGKTPIVGGLSGSFSAVWGKGIASYIQDLNGEGMDLLPADPQVSTLKTVETWGAYGSLSYQFSPDLFSSLTYSHVRTYADCSPAVEIPSYRYAQYICANTFYNLNSIAQVGIEYLYGRRVDYGGCQAHDSRLQALLRVSF